MVHRLKVGTVAAMAAAFAASGAAPAQPGEVDYRAVAKRVVTEAAGVKPGEIVMIAGSPVELPLLEALETEVLLAGGQPIVSIDFPTARKAAVTGAPMDYLRQPPKADLAMIAAGDVFINAGAVADPTLFSGIDETRVNASREAGQPMVAAMSEKRARSVDIGQAGGIPTAAFAKNQGADYGQMRAMFFRALAVPSETIAARGAIVAAKMQPGGQVRLRSAAGTDVTFRLAAGKPRISTGRAADNDTGKGMASTFLPAGDFYACVDPASADGTIVSPTEFFRGQKVTNFRMTFKGGAMTAVAADGDAAPIRAFFAQLDEPSKHLSLLNIGLNPESRPTPGSDYVSWEMSGVPTIFLGNNNWAGCSQAGEGSYAVHLTGATLAAGGSEVIRNGALAP